MDTTYEDIVFCRESMFLYTLHENNIALARLRHPKRKLFSRPTIFRGQAVSFRECTSVF